MEFAKKIEFLRKYFNTTNAGLEKILELSNGYISNIEKDGTDNPGKLLIALGKKGISTDWFLHSQHVGFLLVNDTPPKGQQGGLLSTPDRPIIDVASEAVGLPANTNILAERGDISVVLERAETVSEAVKRRLPVVVEGGERGVLIPVVGQGLSAGPGLDYAEGEVVRYIKVPAWLARRGHDLVALPVYGDSMEPTLNSGDLVVCDSGGFQGDGIYVLRDEGRGFMFCKRVVWKPEGWEIKSDNSRYDSTKVDDKSIQIVARVIGILKEAK